MTGPRVPSFGHGTLQHADHAGMQGAPKRHRPVGQVDVDEPDLAGVEVQVDCLSIDGERVRVAPLVAHHQACRARHLDGQAWWDERVVDGVDREGLEARRRLDDRTLRRRHRRHGLDR